jgi:hypothetical protein
MRKKKTKEKQVYICRKIIDIQKKKIKELKEERKTQAKKFL